MNKRVTKEVKGRKKKKKSKIGRVILIVLLIVIIIGTVWFADKVNKNGGGMQGIIATALGQDEHTLENLKPIYCLVLGTSQGLSDSIMVCSYNPKTQDASILSIPRDTFYGTNTASATPYYKINAIYPSVGVEKLRTTVEKMLGIDIPYYAVIDTNGIIDLVNEIGGVTFDVPINMNYDDPSQNLHIHIDKGVQLIKGDDTEGLLRFRHNNDGTSYPPEYGDNDYGRMRTQREFIKETVKQTLQLKNVTKMIGLVDIAFKYIDTNIDINEVKDYIPYAINFNVDNIKSERLPGSSKMLNNWSFFLQDVKATNKLVQEMFLFLDETETSDVGDGVSVEILNGTGDVNVSRRARILLESNGYNVTSALETSEVESTLMIDRTNQTEEVKESLKKIFSVEKVYDGEDNSDADVTIILGKEYK